MNKELTTTGFAISSEIAETYENGQNLLKRAQELNRLSEVSQVALGMVLAVVKRTEAYRPMYEDFKSYYQSELGRSKGDVSRLLKVGMYLLDNGFSEETAPQTGYTLLYTSISQFGDDKPLDYVLSAAETNTMAELMENGRENTYGTHKGKWIPAFYCEVCSKYTRNQDDH